MPDGMIYVNYEGKMYCWDKEAERIKVFTDILPISKCPDNVLVELMKKMSEGKQE